MALERHWEAIAPVAFTAFGTTRGRITVTSTKYFKVKMEVIVEDSLLPKLKLEVKRVLSPTQMELGPLGEDINSRSDMSLYGPVGPSIIYSYEQQKKLPSPKEMDLASYAQEPTNAHRVVLVDRWGRKYDSVLDGNGVLRLAVDANVSLNNANINVEFPNEVNIVGMVITGAEQSITLPPQTKQFNIKCRDGAGYLFFGFTMGCTSNPLTCAKVNRGANYSSVETDKNPITIYFKGETIGSIAEIVHWYRI